MIQQACTCDNHNLLSDVDFWFNFCLLFWLKFANATQVWLHKSHWKNLENTIRGTNDIHIIPSMNQKMGSDKVLIYCWHKEGLNRWISERSVNCKALVPKASFDGLCCLLNDTSDRPDQPQIWRHCHIWDEICTYLDDYCFGPYLASSLWLERKIKNKK